MIKRLGLILLFFPVIVLGLFCILVSPIIYLFFGRNIFGWFVDGVGDDYLNAIGL